MRLSLLRRPPVLPLERGPRTPDVMRHRERAAVKPRLLHVDRPVLGLFVFLFALGGGYGYWWWVNRPAYLLATAQQALDQADAARDRGDTANARLHYESAERYLQKLLAADKEPGNVAGWVLRGRTLSRYALLLKKEEDEADRRGQPVAVRRSPELFQQIWASYERAATLDRHHAEAHMRLMRNYLFHEQIIRAAPYAAKLVHTEYGQNSDGEWASYDSDQATAQFVLAWLAVNHLKPPRPEEALDHLRRAHEHEAKAVGAGQPLAKTRWRAVAVEAQALALQAEQTRQLLANGRREQAQELANVLDRLRAKLPGWLDRARAEKDESLPTTSAEMPNYVHSVASMALRPSPTDLPSLLEILVLGVQYAATPNEALQRAELALAVCEKLTSAPNPPHVVLREVSQRLPRLTDGVVKRTQYLVQAEKQDDPDMPHAPAWLALRQRSDDLAERIVRQSGAEDPNAYLSLARGAQRDGRTDAARQYALKGLEIIEKAKKALPADADTAAKQRLVKTSAGLNAVAAWAHLTRKQLSDAARHVADLRSNADLAIAGQVHWLHGVLALLDGRLELGLRELELARQHPRGGESVVVSIGLAHACLAVGKMERALAELERLRPAYEKFDRLAEDEKAVADLLLPGPAALKLETVRCQLALGNWKEVQENKEKLADLPEGITARLLVVQYHLAKARKVKGTRLASLNAARKELLALPPAGEDVRVTAAEADRLLAQAEGSFSGVGQAEEWLRRGDGPAAVLWLRWLVRQQRLDEAATVLRRLEADVTPEGKRRAGLARSELQLARAEPAAVALLEPWQSDKSDLQIDLIGLASGSRHEEIGARLLEQAVASHARGDCSQAARLYGRAMQYAALKPAARRGLLTSLLALGERESPSAANDLAGEMLRTLTDEPALLLAFAETAVLLDNIHGSQGMEGALRTLDALLSDQRQEAAGAYLLARGWAAAARPDLARRELDRALKAEPKHRRALRLAIELAVGAEDWQRCLDLATLLRAAQPDDLEALRGRAVALENLGRTADAAQAYQEIVSKFPDHALGYLGIARLLANGEDTVAALSWTAQACDHTPDNAAALELRVRLLALVGRTTEAESSAEQMLIQTPVNGPNLMTAAAKGFFAAGALDRAEAWARRVATSPGSDVAHISAELLLGDIYRTAARQAPATKESADKALAVFKNVYEKVPGHLAAGTALAALLLEHGETEAALAVVQQMRLGRSSRKPVGGDRLPLDAIDTMAAVFTAARQYRDAVTLLNEAAKRYADEPRIYVALGRTYTGLKQAAHALENLAKGAALARQKADVARDPRRKVELLALADEALLEQKKLREQDKAKR